MEQPNQDKIRTLGEKEINKYLGILEAYCIKQVQMKEIFFKKGISGERESFSKPNNIAEALSKYLDCSRKIFRTILEVDQRRT